MIHRKPHLPIIVCLCSFLSVSELRAQSFSSSMDDFLDRSFPYAATNVDINRVIFDLSTMAGIPIIADENLTGTITVSNRSGMVEDALYSIAEQVPIVWWFDGAAVRIEAQSQMNSRLVSLGQTPYADFLNELRAMDLHDPRFPIRPASQGTFVRIVAPDGYIQEAELLIEQMNAPRSLHVCTRPKSDGSVEEFVMAGMPLVLRGQ